MYKLSLQLPHHAIEPFVAALEPFADSLSVHNDDDDKLGQIDVYAEKMPESSDFSLALALVAAATGVDEPPIKIESVAFLDSWFQTPQPDSFAIGRWMVVSAYDPRCQGKLTTEFPGYTPIIMDAAQAFGSGTHPTTQGCLLAISEISRLMKRPYAALDIGCGSGILAIALAKQFHCPILAIDCDPQALVTCRHYAQMNGVSHHIQTHLGDGVHGTVPANQGPYDIIAANILARPLLGLAPQLPDYLAPGGYLILSGLLLTQELSILHAYRTQGFRLVKRWPIGDWVTVLLTVR